jgi:hypothetical protein
LNAWIAWFELWTNGTFGVTTVTVQVRRFGFCNVRPISSRRRTPIERIDIGDLDGCVWHDRGLGYSLIADETYDKLVELSRYVRHEVGSQG